MIDLRVHNCLLVLFLSSLIFASFGLQLKRPVSSKKNEDQKEDKAAVSDDEYEAWLEEQIDQQLALLESMFEVSEALSIADAPLDYLDEDFLDELLKSRSKSGTEVSSQSEHSPSSSESATDKDQLQTKKGKTSEKSKGDDLEHLLELAVNVLGSTITESENKKTAHKTIAKKPLHSCLNEQSEIAKCSGEFQRWIVYKNGDFCKPTSDGGCQGSWNEPLEPVDCLEICIYSPSAQEKKLSIRLAANLPSPQYTDRNESSFWS